MNWIDENLLRGVPPLNVVKILRIKGFQPCRNLALMQQICIWVLLDDFLIKHPKVDIEGTSVDPYLQSWIRGIVNRGIEGSVVIKILESRGINLKPYQPYFAQKLVFNELGCVMRKDGKEAKLFDYWVACAEGCYREVELYLESGMPANEAKLGRHDNISRTPLALAALNGHVEVMKLLLRYNADVNLLDNRGRTALHVAASKGHVEACSLLLKHGSRIFDGDFQGNTALHLAAMGNHVDTVDLLAFQGQELSRSITSDRIWPRSDMSFDQLAAYVFRELPERKLRKADTRRFEKVWLGEGARMFVQEMDPKLRYMMAIAADDVVKDVLKRFDEWPNSGIVISIDSDGSAKFIPTFATPENFATMLRYLFRQSALDNTNNMRRTALHLACDENIVLSHENTIQLLIDIHGANVWLRDMHGKTPYELLIQDTGRSSGPSATRLREEVLFESRAKLLQDDSDAIREKEEKLREECRSKTLSSCIVRAEFLSNNIWLLTQEASLLRLSAGVWDVYDDPDTLNVFYCKQPIDAAMGDPFTDFSWTIPDAARTPIHRAWAWSYQRTSRSQYLRTIGAWDMYRCSRTNFEFYHNGSTDQFQLIVPEDISFSIISMKNPVLRRLGFNNHWEEHKDNDGNIFYRRRNSSECCWERPVDACDVDPVDRVCTTFTHHNMSSYQKYYTCDQCSKTLRDKQQNQVVENDPEKDPNAVSANAKSSFTLRLCEPCAVRCHRNHRGVRYVRDGKVLCLCQSLCQSFNKCCGRETSKLQKKIERETKQSLQEKKRIRERNALCPPVFALAPNRNADGSPRREGGWTICRRAPPVDPYVSYRKLLAAQAILKKQKEANDVDDNSLESSLDSLDSETSAATGEQTKNIDMSGVDLDDDDEAQVELLPLSSIVVKPSSDISKVEINTGGGYLGGQPLPTAVVAALENDFPNDPPEGLPEGWIEVLDPEEPLHPAVGSRVLWWRLLGNSSSIQRKYYGTIVHKGKWGTYTIRPASGGDKDIIVPRERFEVISRNTFYCHLESGLCAWSIKEALEQPQPSCSICISGDEWLRFQMYSKRRRLFKAYEECEDGLSGIIFYVNEELLKAEKAAIVIQTLWRQKRNICLSFLSDGYVAWRSDAFSMDVPTSVMQEQRILAGWALLRRRSTMTKELCDINGIDWEEYVDSDSSELFYWYEEENLYQWTKPILPDPVTVANTANANANKKNTSEILEVGQEVIFFQSSN